MLSDFGIALVLEQATTQLTATGMGVGTPEYMAPEQWKGESCEASDQFGLGVVLFELLTGQKPFTAETPLAVALKVMSEPLPQPSSLVEDIPEGVEKVLYKMLAREPYDRFQRMEVCQSVLNRYAGPISSPLSRESKRVELKFKSRMSTRNLTDPKEESQTTDFVASNFEITEQLQEEISNQLFGHFDRDVAIFGRLTKAENSYSYNCEGDTLDYLDEPFNCGINQVNEPKGRILYKIMRCHPKLILGIMLISIGISWLLRSFLTGRIEINVLTEILISVFISLIHKYLLPNKFSVGVILVLLFFLLGGLMGMSLVLSLWTMINILLLLGIVLLSLDLFRRKEK
ncbi:MAG: protein kinase [Brevefilum sp.]|nr:protein kinase [Brevefilum sp.]